MIKIYQEVVGRIELIIGPMFSQKSTELISRLKLHSEVDRKIQAFKPKKDDRYTSEYICTHDGLKFESKLVSSAKEIYQLLEPDTQVIAIDEITLLDSNIIELVLHLAKQGKTVIMSGLNLDFTGVRHFPFSDFDKKARHIGHLMPFAEITYKYSICKHKENGVICGRNALYSHRLKPKKNPDGTHAKDENGKFIYEPAHFNDPVIVVGGKGKDKDGEVPKDRYEARCQLHHVVPGRPEIDMKDFD